MNQIFMCIHLYFWVHNHICKLLYPDFLVHLKLLIVLAFLKHHKFSSILYWVSYTLSFFGHLEYYLYFIASMTNNAITNIHIFIIVRTTFCRYFQSDIIGSKCEQFKINILLLSVQLYRIWAHVEFVVICWKELPALLHLKLYTH